MKIFEKTREYVNKGYKEDEAQMKHFDRAVFWLQHLRPGADEALLVAAIGHDLERAFRDEKLSFESTGRSFSDSKWLEYHSNEGARILGEFLSKEDVGFEFIERVKHLVSKHEVGGDDDQNLLKDADSLSFLENNAPIFLSKFDKLGYDKIKDKFDWMYNRISSSQAQKIGQPFYEKISGDLDELKS